MPVQWGRKCQKKTFPISQGKSKECSRAPREGQLLDLDRLYGNGEAYCAAILPEVMPRSVRTTST